MSAALEFSSKCTQVFFLVDHWEGRPWGKNNLAESYVVIYRDIRERNSNTRASHIYAAKRPHYLSRMTLHWSCNAVLLLKYILYIE
jgi:hypothetical protein